MQDEHYQEIKEAGWRRPLTRDEQAKLRAFLAAHPESRQAADEEAALTRLLERLPAVPVSSNFTARVLQAVQSRPAPASWRDWFALSQWLPQNPGWRIAMCSMVVGLGLISFREGQVAHRQQTARELAGVGRIATLPPMEWLKDFDTINNMNKVKVADDDLLAALK
jgi:hypothetical protein